MLNKLKPKSEFSHNVLTLMTGTTVAQAIPVAISPILTRIYTPEDFGLYSLFIAIAFIFGSIANGRYELAIMLPKKDEDAINIFALGFIITLGISFLLLILIILFHDLIVDFLDNDKIGIWLYFIPITVFFIGFFNILNYFNIRKKYYKNIANSKIFKSIILAILQLSIGFIKQGAMGLISGQIVSQIFANWQLFKNIIKDKTLLSKITIKNIWIEAKKYKDFPKFSLWGVFANTLSIHFTNILISSFFTISTLGFYSLVQKILGMPSALIGSSIGQVFFQEASEEKMKTSRAINTFKKTINKLILLGVPLYGLLYFIIEDVFAIVFGEEWRIAGVYAQILIPLFFIKFISVAVSTTFSIFNRLKFELFLKILLLIGIITILFFFKEKEFQNYLFYFMCYSSFIYLLSLYFSYKLAKGTA